jgi:archaeal flagellar protein FlaJ
MKTWAIVSVFVILCCMSYFLLINEIFFFLISFLLFPFILILNYYHENGFPEIRDRFKINKSNLFKINNVTQTKSDIFDKFILKIPMIQKMQEYFVKAYSDDLVISGMAKSPVDVGLKSIKFTVLTTGLCLIFVIFLFVSSQNIAVFMILVIPIMLFFASRFNLKSTISERKKGIEKELLFFVVFCDIMDNVQSEIYKVFEIISNDDTKLFPFMKKEALILDRDINVFGNSSINSMVKLSQNHPSKLFTDFIQGYLTSQSFGGRDTGDYLADKTRELQIIAKQKMNSYIEFSDKISEMGVFGMIMYPMLVVISSSMVPGNTLFLLIIFGLIFIPITIFLLIKKIDTIQPFPNNFVSFRKEPIIISVIAAAISVILGLEYWEIFIIPMMAWSLSNFVYVRKNFLINVNLDASVPRFVRDLNQIMLSTPSFFQSFKLIQKKESYTLEFNMVLKQINSKIILGNSLHEVMLNLKISSWLSKIMINLLSYTSKSGIVTPTVMEKLASFSNNYLESKKEMAEKTSTGLIIGYMGPIIVIIMIMILPSISIESFTENFDDSNFVNDIQIDNTLTVLTSVLVIIVSFFSMLLISKIKYSTINYSLHSGIILVILSAFLYYDKYVGISI